MLTLITCPTCHHKFTVPEDAMGHRRTCPNCQSIFVAGKSVAETNGRMNGSARCGLLERAAAEERSPKAPIDQTMLGEVGPPAPPIRYNCPRCKKPLESPAAEAGTKKPCPSCGGRLQVPAAPSPAPDSNLNKTLLASAECSGLQTHPKSVVATYPPVAVTPEPRPATITANGKPMSELLSGRGKYVAAGIAAAVLVLVVLFFNGKANADENQRFLQAQKQELDKLRAEIDQKTAALQLQQQRETEQRQAWEEMKAKQDARQRELDREREFELQKLALLNDAKQAAEAKARLDQKQRELEEEKRAEAERRARAERDMHDQMESLRRQLDNANQKSTTIVTQPPPPPVYPWYRYGYPWW